MIEFLSLFVGLVLGVHTIEVTVSGPVADELVGGVLAAGPTRLEAAARQVVDGDRRLGQQTRIAVADVEHETAEPRMLRVGGERAERPGSCLVRSW